MKNRAEAIQAIQKRQKDMWAILDERGRRLFAASEARAIGRGGSYLVEEATGVARSTINRGKKELKAGVSAGSKQRRPGGGCKKKRLSSPPLSTT
jgi:hypothetical protein